MNIFATDRCPAISAENLDDKRVVKMILESAQMLSTAMYMRGSVGPYKPVHRNHPCTKWVTEDRTDNSANWLIYHMEFLCDIYTEVYNRQHKCELLIPQFRNYFYDMQSIPTWLAKFQNCTTFKEEEDVFTAYHLYLCEKWDNDKRQPTWKLRGEPEFYKKHKAITNSKKTEL